MSMTKWILVRPKSGCVRAKIGLTGQLVDEILPLIFEVHCYSQCIIQRSSSALLKTELLRHSSNGFITTIRDGG